ncbi:MAG: ABC-2 family transporter protein [Bacilli bacterium]|nr:ABC-2 family transporter protein [Bacilli bacterium]
MLMAVRNNIRIMLLSIKYNLMKAMENKVAFLTSVIMMIFNNATFIIQWVTIFSLKEVIGSYTFSDVMFFWAMASGSFGFAHILFNGAYKIPEYIEQGKLDAYLTMPKNTLCQVITSSLEPSAVGDLIYGYIALIIFNFSIKNILLYTLLIPFGGIIYVSIVVIYNSLTFRFYRSSYLTDAIRDVFINTSLYPDIIFNKIVKFVSYTFIPSGFACWIPVHLLMDFNIKYFLILLGGTILFIIMAFISFNKGLKSYTSSNLMSARY